MTIYSDVHQCLSSLKGASASFSDYAAKSTDREIQRIFHEAMMETDQVIADLQLRIAQLEREEPQYKKG